MTKPVPFHGFIGQRRAVQLIRAQADGAKASGKPFPNAILMGQSGLGKTELARAIAAEMGMPMHRIVASGESDDLSRIKEARSHDIVFVDEAHALRHQEQESLFAYLDAGALPSCGDDQSLPICTFILATDQPGRLVQALHRRMPIQIMLSPYSEEEMIDIISRIASIYGIAITAQARRMLARSAQGNPRIARHRTQLLSTYAQVAMTKSVDQPTVQAFLATHGVDDHQRTESQVAYLHGLHRIGGTASLETISGQIGADACYVERMVEPFLLAQGWITKTSRGRSLTADGIATLTVKRTGPVGVCCDAQEPDAVVPAPEIPAPVLSSHPDPLETTP